MFDIKMHVDFDGENPVFESYQDGETIPVPIGALVLLKVVIVINHTYYAKILSSHWELSGYTIIPGTVTQNMLSGDGTTHYNRSAAGGYQGDQSRIETGWIDNADMRTVKIKGYYEYQGRTYPYDILGYVQIAKPFFDTSLSKPEFVIPVKIDEDGLGEHPCLTTQWISGSKNIKYRCSDILQGGQIGFFQTVDGNRFRSGKSVEQIKGFKTINGCLDTDEENNFFYISETALETGDLRMDDQPTEPLIKQATIGDVDVEFDRYKIGSSYTTTGYNGEYFITHLGYKAPLSERITASFLVVNKFTEWFWCAEAVADRIEEWKLSYGHQRLRPWCEGGWNLAYWDENTINAKKWR